MEGSTEARGPCKNHAILFHGEYPMNSKLFVLPRRKSEPGLCEHALRRQNESGFTQPGAHFFILPRPEVEKMLGKSYLVMQEPGRTVK